MKNRKYPISLFIFGFLMNVVFRFWVLFVLGIVFSVVGIFVKSFVNIGLAILLLDVALSFVEQMRLRQTFLEESDDSDFEAFKDMMSNDGNWMGNVREFLNDKISNPDNEFKPDNENEENDEDEEDDE